MIDEQTEIKRYMEEIRQIPLVSVEEEKRLAKEIKEGNEEARQKLISSNLRFVVKLAYDFRGRGLPLLDLISEGNIGLIKAVGKFDPSKGAKLSSYSAWWIKQSMRRAIANQSRTIRIPIASASKIDKINQAKENLEVKLGRPATNKEVAEYAKITPRTLKGYNSRLPAVLKTIPLHEVISKHGETFELIVGENDPKFDTFDRDGCFHYLKQLDERERTVLVYRLGLDGHLPRTLGQVSEYIGRTRERVRQIQNLALEKLRKAMKEDYGN